MPPSLSLRPFHPAPQRKSAKVSNAADTIKSDKSQNSELSHDGFSFFGVGTLIACFAVVRDASRLLAIFFAKAERSILNSAAYSGGTSV